MSAGLEPTAAHWQQWRCALREREKPNRGLARTSRLSTAAAAEGAGAGPAAVGPLVLGGRAAAAGRPGSAPPGAWATTRHARDERRTGGACGRASLGLPAPHTAAALMPGAKSALGADEELGSGREASGGDNVASALVRSALPHLKGAWRGAQALAEGCAMERTGALPLGLRERPLESSSLA